MDKNEGKSCVFFSIMVDLTGRCSVTAGRSGPFSEFYTVLVIIIILFAGAKRVGGVPSERIALLHRLGRHAPHRQHVHGWLCSKSYPAGKNLVHTLRVSPQGVGWCTLEVLYICVVAVFILRTNDNCSGSYKVTVHSFLFCSREVLKLF